MPAATAPAQATARALATLSVIAGGLGAIPIAIRLARWAVAHPLPLDHAWMAWPLAAAAWTRWRFGAAAWGAMGWALGVAYALAIGRHGCPPTWALDASRFLLGGGTTIAALAMWEHAVAERRVSIRLPLRWALAPIAAAIALEFSDHHRAAPMLVLMFAVQLACARALVRQPGHRPVGGTTLANTVCGYGMFAVSCTLMPLFSVLLLAAGRRRGALLRGGMRRWMRLVYAITPTVRWHWLGDDATLSGRRVVVSNHESILDILSACALPGTRNLLAKTWVFRAPFLGLAARFAGIRNADRLERAEDEESAAITAPSMLADEGLYVFPEGRRTRDGRIHRFRLGAFALADTQAAEVVPVALAGSAWAVPAGQSWIHPGDVISEILPPMRRQPFEPLRTFASRTRATIAAARFARMRSLLHGANARRQRAGWYTGLPPRCRSAARAEAAAGGWGAVAVAAADVDDDWLLIGCGWGSVAVTLRLLVRPARLLAIEPDPVHRTVARHVWFRPDHDALTAERTAVPTGRIRLATGLAFAEAIALVTPESLASADVRAAVVPVADRAAWLQALPALRHAGDECGMAILRTSEAD